MRGFNTWIQRLLTAKSCGKSLFTWYMNIPVRSGTTRDDPKGIPRDGPLVRPRGDPTG